MSTAQKRKQFHDWLDSQRPWAHTNGDVYPMMERIVAKAAEVFCGELAPPTREYVGTLEQTVRELTTGGTVHREEVAEHGLCLCADCLAAAGEGE